MLVFSHDEAVHGKSSMLGKMPGEREQKFANLRLTYAYMFTHPGRKLLFMGQDIGEFSEWNEMRQTEWELLKYPDHKGLAALVKKLNELYTTKPALYEWDDKPEGFAWINSINSTENLLTFMRRTRKKESLLVVAANFSGVEKQVKIGVPYEGSYKEILNTDAEEFGGNGMVNKRAKRAVKKEWDDRPYSVSITLAPLSVSILEFRPANKSGEKDR